MENFQRLMVDGYFEGYYKTERLSNNQTISLYLLRSELSRGIEYTVVLAIGKKKHIRQWISGESSYLDNKETGKCGLEGLIWAKRNLIAFEEYIQSNNIRYGKHQKPKEVFICVYWLDNRRRNIYEYGLKKLGYEMGFRNGQKGLYKKIW